MNGPRAPIADLSPLGIVKSIDEQRTRRPDCVVTLMPNQADVVRAALMREHDAALASRMELEKARELVEKDDARPDALAAGEG